MRKYEGIKKIDINCNFIGSLNIDLVSKWMHITKNEASDIMCRTQGIKDYSDYISKYKLPLELLQNKTHLKDATKYLINDLYCDGVIYAEIIISPLLHTKKGLTPEDVLDSIIDELDDKVITRLILAIDRSNTLRDSKRIINLAKKYKSKGVAGITLIGDETLYPTLSFKELFAYADEKEVKFTVTAGESGTFKDIINAVNFGAKRISCGIEAIKDFKTMELLKKKNVPLEVCLSNNIDMNLTPSINTHPISRLIDSGVSITIGSGNRTISKTDLSHEYYLLNKYFNFTKEDFEKFNQKAINFSLLDEDEKKTLIEAL